MPTSRSNAPRAIAFRTELGWFALLGAGPVLWRVTLGHARRRSALAALGPADPSPWDNADLVERLRRYAAGGQPDLTGVQVELGQMSPFRRAVLEACRAIPYGRTVSYGQLAARVGRPGAARAVGAAMAANPCPIVIPCHRVVAASGGLGGFSAPSGVELKRRLLEMESVGG